jgi:hypothetical protein
MDLQLFRGVICRPEDWLCTRYWIPRRKVQGDVDDLLDRRTDGRALTTQALSNDGTAVAHGLTRERRGNSADAIPQSLISDGMIADVNPDRHTFEFLPSPSAQLATPYTAAAMRRGWCPLYVRRCVRSGSDQRSRTHQRFPPAASLNWSAGHAPFRCALP